MTDGAGTAPHDEHHVHPLLGKTSLTLAVMLALLAVPYLSPKLAAFRVGSGAASAPSGPEEPEREPERAAGETELAATENAATVSNALPAAPLADAIDPQLLAKTKGSLAVEDPTGQAMTAFYKSLAATKAKAPGAVTRVMHYGDSLITADYISGTMRRKMQERFGDSGHGFILLANPWEWYFHNDVSHAASDGWSASRITGPFVGDKAYGLGGVTFRGKPGATASFGTAKKGTHGTNVSRFDVYYLAQPGGGTVEAKIGKTSETFSTTEDAKVSRVKSFTVPDGEARLELRVVGGSPRLFGVALERDRPGVVYDALGANGARAYLWDGIDTAHWKEQMALRKPALVVLQFGTNESEAGRINVEYYQAQLGKLVDHVKEAAPSASVLVAAPLDRAEKDSSGKIKSRPVIAALVSSQRKVALAKGVAFWNTFEAMGGEGSMAQWVRAQPQLGSGDYTHPTPAGAEVLGDLMFKALTAGFEAYEARGGR